MPNWATAYDFESVTVGATAVGFTEGKYKSTNPDVRKATTALVTVENDAIRFRLDGTNPTSAVGHQLASAGTILLEGYDNIKNFRAIRVTTDAVLRVSFMK